MFWRINRMFNYGRLTEYIVFNFIVFFHQILVDKINCRIVSQFYGKFYIIIPFLKLLFCYFLLLTKLTWLNWLNFEWLHEKWKKIIYTETHVSIYHINKQLHYCNGIITYYITMPLLLTLLPVSQKSQIIKYKYWLRHNNYLKTQ